MNDEFGRQPVTIVEIDQDFCALTYGTSPCTAAIGVTGVHKCFNTVATCQDRVNFDKSHLTLRFCTPAANIPASWQAIPSVKSVSTAPTRLNIGGASDATGPLGRRAQVTIKLGDHPYSDAKTDPYLSDRTYDPLSRGTFWTKFLARSPFYQNRPLRIREGYIGQDPEDMVTRYYIIDGIDGPDSGGNVTIKGVDILRLVDDRRTKAPMLSRGELDSAINDSVTSFDVIGATEDEYPATGTLRIGSEVMTYTGRSETSGVITFTGVTRGTDGTEAEEHDAESSVQSCLRYTSQAGYLVALDLIEKYAGDVFDVVDEVEWLAEGAFWLPQFIVSGLITEPTGINTLLSELAEQCQFFIWWDEREQKVRLRANRPPTEDPLMINERDHIIQGSIGIQVKPEERISQVWVYYGIRNPTGSLTSESNYSRVRIRVDGDAESDLEFNESKVRRIFSRWIFTDAVAQNIAVRLLDRYRNNPRYLTVLLDAKDRDKWTADIIDVTTRLITDATGEDLRRRYIVIEAEETKPGEVIKYLLQSADVLTGRFGFWTVSDAPDYENATEGERATMGFWADENGLMPDGEPGYQWQ